LLIEPASDKPELAAHLLFDSIENSALALRGLKFGELGSHCCDERTLNAEVDRMALPRLVTNHEQIVGTDPLAGPTTPGRGDRSLANERRAVGCHELSDNHGASIADRVAVGRAVLVDRIAIFRNHAFDWEVWVVREAFGGRLPNRRQRFSRHRLSRHRRASSRSVVHRRSVQRVGQVGSA
jgi:hypothetical protein